MFHTETTKAKVLHRLKIIRGHLDKVIQMVESDRYCIDILTQTKALESSLHKVDEEILENHLSTCVIDHIQHGQTKQAVAEIMKIFGKTK